MPPRYTEPKKEQSTCVVGECMNLFSVHATQQLDTQSLQCNFQLQVSVNEEWPATALGPYNSGFNLHGHGYLKK